MGTKLRMIAPVWQLLQSYHLSPAVRRERISYVFGSSITSSDGNRTIIVAAPPKLFNDDCYITQAGAHVSLDPVALNALLVDFAESDHDCLINIHDHHFAASGTVFSSIDTADEQRLDFYIRKRFEPMLEARPDIGRPRQVINVALVLDQAGCDARYLDGDGRFKVIDRIDVVGERSLRVVPNSASTVRSNSPDETLQRQADFIPTECQTYLAETVFAIVGCGGLGSILAEVLVRMGARRLILIDDDILETHNLNRWQGGTIRDVGNKKVTILSRRLRKMVGRGRLAVKAVPHSIFSVEGEEALKRADVVLAGLDNHLARYFLNRFAVQYAVPYFDAGVNIVAGKEVDFQSRYFAVIPGTTACMECSVYSLLDRAELGRALMDDVTASERRAAGYVDGRPEITGTAAAYPVNMHAVTTLTTELLNWICGLRPLATCALDRWRDGWHQRSDRENHPESPNPNCPACGIALGAADGARLPRPLREGHAVRMLEAARTLVRAPRPMTPTA